MGNKKKLQRNSLQGSGIERYSYLSEPAASQELAFFNDGDLVSNIFGQIGIIIGYGPSDGNLKLFYNCEQNYYKVLIEGTVYNYIPGSLKKVKK